MATRDSPSSSSATIRPISAREFCKNITSVILDLYMDQLKPEYKKQAICKTALLPCKAILVMDLPIPFDPSCSREHHVFVEEKNTWECLIH